MIHIRVPEQLKAQIEQAAKDSARSVNAEVIFRLEMTFSEQQKNGKAVYKLPSKNIEDMCRAIEAIKKFQDVIQDMNDIEKKTLELEEFIKKNGNPDLVSEKKLLSKIISASSDQKKAILTLLEENKSSS